MNSDTRPDIVLVVDDDLHIRLLLARVLERAGMAVHLAEDGEVAIARFQQGGVALIVFDCEMPGMSGIEMLRAIRSLPGGAHLPAVMLTALGQGDAETRAAALGVTRFFGKPFSPSELSRAVRALLQADPAPAL
jgi:DNA-binding response OmpR family regulator